MRPSLWPVFILLTCLLRASAMDVNDVTQVLRDAANRARIIAPNSIIAVVDREGFVLAVQSIGTIPIDPGQRTLAIAVAVSKAGTAAFLSSHDNAFSSRTAGYIVQQHFPPEVRFTPNGPLVGVNFSNLSFSDVNRFKDPATYMAGMNGGTNGAPVPFSSLAGAPGGMPLYKNGVLIGGLGVTTDGSEILSGIQGLNQVYDVNEDVALAGQWHYPPSDAILGSKVFIDGIRVEYNESSTKKVKYLPGIGQPVAPYTVQGSPLVAYPQMELGGVLGEIRQPIIGDASNAPLGAARLTGSEVTNILSLAAARARITRAGIRLPPGKAAQVFITVVNNPNAPGATPQVLGTFRTSEATIFSWDVAVQKARTALYFSTDTRAFSTRTVSFLSQSLFPPGIEGTSPGPFFGLQERFSLFPLGTNTLNGAIVPASELVLKPELANGMTIFAGGFPLYRNGVLIGAIGVSGDGIDQDDIIAASGTVNFLAPEGIRADRFLFRGARLPYAKFPRNPSL
jgi:uncharacterized protein GlcG (DUF336 family)